MQGIDPAATAWLLASTALVLLMTPGLAIFYGGMVRTTGVLNMIMMSFISIPLVTVAWLLFGYTLAFSSGDGFLGSLEHVGMAGITPSTTHGTVPELLFATFQLTFAIITAALISGAIADRAKFSAWMVFVPVWAIAVYSVIAHWVWGPDGWLAKLGALDYAGGLVVEIASGASALALAIVLGPRIGFKQDAMRPHNLPFVLLGVGLLWFGWFGFNAGSALAADGKAAAIFLNTLVAGCLGMLGWLTVEQVRDGKPTTFGAASGVVAGLVAITPSCGTVNTLGALIVGLAAGVVCSFAVGLKFKLNYDDSLDVVGVHFVGGIVGVVLIGLLATDVMTGGARGLFYGGGFTQLGKQLLAMAIVAGYAFTATFVLGKIIDKVMGFRVSAEDETAGVDFTQHAETAYAEGVHGHLGTRRPSGSSSLSDLLKQPRPDVEDA
ncbi:ammonium transporter [Mycobacterium sp. CBMA293]|uniref:ammonium transporter n=1 Tax=unclassified Mycolicibacterium TaxID=2636767 RepID=UPI001322875A|nr:MULTISPECIES: ammonium transporter [unclassified Mycolicibacterium]MUL47953.1 ammonium transporter [Mycolicibacterium sp. CBMA 360]MUL94567.1 ammonium transporter [Mycolicibacterium sp. CBMA 230]MUM30591.1 ammonium transporter [Mycolicibacterium sp. CBMA 361]MUL59199.1 ammonium transporter [Mycolicibacterium sp. CBMA 335]MUL70924.1 ammonium transporter [Mycolicibacterium sp. CBMA 311]